eukprot:g6073.t1
MSSQQLPPTWFGSTHRPTVVENRPNNSWNVNEMPLTLEYFCLQGLGEGPRLLLEATRTTYDNVLHFSGPGNEYKSVAPHGQMPLLHDKQRDVLVCQSGAIAMYLAELTNTQGKNSAERAKVNMNYFLSKDIATNLGLMHESDGEKRAKLDGYLSAAEKVAPQPGKAYFVGDALTYADCFLFQQLNAIKQLAPHCLKSFPRLTAFVESFASLPAVKAYLESGRRLPISTNEKKMPNVEWCLEGYKLTEALHQVNYEKLWTGARE